MTTSVSLILLWTELENLVTALWKESYNISKSHDLIMVTLLATLKLVLT